METKLEVLDLPGHLIDGTEVSISSDTDVVESIDPYTGDLLWSTQSADQNAIDLAVSSASRAFATWSRAPFEHRKQVIEDFGVAVKASADSLATVIAQEGGKPLWEAKAEVNSLINKIAASIEGHEKRVADSSREVRGMLSRTRFLPHGVMAVLGPFNFPVSMANSHIMPALLSGNTVVFKPSELTPRAGIYLAQLWQNAGLPPGALNCVSGGRDSGSDLVNHPNIDGVLFVGSHGGGMAILRTLVEQPQKIVALEMGGNNPLVIWDYDDVDTVVNIIIQSTFISAGQRCTAARRLFVRKGDDRLLARLCEVLRSTRIGHYLDSPEPYYGAVIRPSAATRVIQRTDELLSGGASFLLTSSVSGPAKTVITPGVIDVTNCDSDRDEEIFGPVLKVHRFEDFSEAVDKANDTRFGLAAGIVCRDRAVYDKFFSKIKAGIINWNQQITGATTSAPFGGIKESGNFRPAGFMSADYCSYCTASFEVEKPQLPDKLPPGISFP